MGSTLIDLCLMYLRVVGRDIVTNQLMGQLRLATIAFLSVVFLLGSLSIPLAFASQPTSTVQEGKQRVAGADAKKAKPEKTAYDYNLPGANGKDVPLTNFKGKYILIVNLARK